MFNAILSPSFNIFSNIALRWTPRMAVATYAGYYSLGFAYQRGLLAAIDKIAIRILISHFGYAGVGAMMPLAQWYTAWAVRIGAALLAAVVYDLSERVVITVYRHYFKPVSKIEKIAIAV